MSRISGLFEVTEHDKDTITATAITSDQRNLSVDIRTDTDYSDEIAEKVDSCSVGVIFRSDLVSEGRTWKFEEIYIVRYC